MKKVVTFACPYMQRNRSFLHMIDPLLESGYEVRVKRKGKPFRAKDWENDISGVRGANLESYHHLADNFGLEVKGMDKVRWVDKVNFKHVTMSIDGFSIGGHKTTLNIPFQGIFARRKGMKKIAGNFMSEHIRQVSKIVPEDESQVLIIHPGGARGIVSPLGEDMEISQIKDNNRKFLEGISAAIPSSIKKIVIKTHPLPFKGNDAKSLTSVLPDPRMVATGTELTQYICQSKYVVNFGSSTLWWIMGGDKRWLNVINCARYNLDHEDRRDVYTRADDWWSFPQNIKLEQLSDYIENYDRKVDLEETKLKTKAGVPIGKLFGLDTTKVILMLLSEIVR